MKNHVNGNKDVKNGKKDLILQNQFIFMFHVMVVAKHQLLEIDLNVMIVKILIFVQNVMKNLKNIIQKNIHLKQLKNQFVVENSLMKKK